MRKEEDGEKSVKGRRTNNKEIKKWGREEKEKRETEIQTDRQTDRQRDRGTRKNRKIKIESAYTCV